MLAFLHTAHSHVESFELLAREIDRTVVTRHQVHEQLLADAVRAGGITAALRAAIADAIQDLAARGAALIVCTCSTLGAEAESVAGSGSVVMRIDRPMAEEAVSSGRRILVVAALRSTLAPTVSLLREVASQANRSPLVAEALSEHAWPLFEAGDRPAYAAEVAKTIEHTALPGDVVVLAQASMDAARELVRHLAIPVLSSPRSGVIAAMSKYRSLVPGASG